MVDDALSSDFICSKGEEDDDDDGRLLLLLSVFPLSNEDEEVPPLSCNAELEEDVAMALFAVYSMVECFVFPLLSCCTILHFLGA